MEMASQSLMDREPGIRKASLAFALRRRAEAPPLKDPILRVQLHLMTLKRPIKEGERKQLVLMVVLEGLPCLKKERAMSLLVSGFVPTLVVRKVRKLRESGWWTAGDV